MSHSATRDRGVNTVMQYADRAQRRRRFGPRLASEMAGSVLDQVNNYATNMIRRALILVCALSLSGLGCLPVAMCEASAQARSGETPNRSVEAEPAEEGGPTEPEALPREAPVELPAEGSALWSERQAQTPVHEQRPTRSAAERGAV